jgi:predicted ATPase/DNA-binding CsgD family transcriptional regulator
VKGGAALRTTTTSGSLTSFVGRESETAELAARLDDVRLLTLVGAPGIGKTRLGLEVSTRLAERHPGGVHVVELAAIADPASTVQAVATVLGIPDLSGPAESAVVERLGERASLLVLDNCEHLADAVATLVARLLAECPPLRVLATSRVALGLRGEQVWPVAPLDAFPAVQLFRDRALLAAPTATIEADPAVMERICTRLDGLPLAIELAAALTRVLSPGEILGRLDRALPLLASRSRDANPRQRTMEATVDWSYRLLGPAEQLLFDRLSVFAGGFDLAAAQAITPEGDVLSHLVTLVDHSLVLVAPGAATGTRYRLLEPIRQYAEARFGERGGQVAVRRRHAEHYLAVARRLDDDLRTDRLPVALRQLEEDDGNLRAALDTAASEPDDLGLRLCAALARSWDLRGRVIQGRIRFGHMLKVETTDRQLRASALSHASRLAWRQHDYAAARALLEESLAIERERRDGRRVARRLNGLAMVVIAEGDIDEARRLLGESITLCRAGGDRDTLAVALAIVALGLQLAGQPDQAAPYVEEALELGRASGNLPASVHSLGAAVFGAILMQDLASLRAYATEAAGMLRLMGWIYEEPTWLWAAIALASSEGRYRSALRLAGALDAVERRDGLRCHEHVVRHMRPWLERARRHVSAAEQVRLTGEGARMTEQEMIDETLRTSDTPDERPLTSREAEVAALVAQGHNNVEIAADLYISKRTVETHVAHIKAKLGVARRSDVVAWVLDLPPLGGGNHPSRRPSAVPCVWSD